VKTGPGKINVFCNGWNSRTYTVPKTKLQGGMFRIGQYEGNVSNGHEFWFDSNDPDLCLQLFYKRDGATDYGPERYNWVIKNGALRESAAVQNHDHQINSSQTNLLVFTGTPTVNPMTFTGRLTGNAGLKWNPTTASEFTFSGGDSTSSGRIIVSNGTVRVTNGARFSALASLLVDGASSVFAIDGTSCCDFSATQVTLANGGTFALAENARACANVLTVNGAAIAAGDYSGTAGVGVTAVSWITGAGVLRVGSLPEGSATATWTKLGTGDISADANWDGGVAPELGGGTTLVTVASTVSGDAEMTIDRDVWLRGIDGQNPGWTTVTGSKTLALGSAGLKTASGRRLVLQAPTELKAAQTWTIRGGGGMEVKAPVSSFPGTALKIDGSGWIDWTAVCPALWGPLTITNLSVRLKGSGSFGPAGAGPVYIYHAGANGSPTYVNGTVVDRDLWLIDGTSKVGEGISRITTPDNGTLTFNGFVCSSNTTTLALTLGKNSTVTFNKLFMSRNAGNIQNGSGGGTAVFNGPYHNRDRFNMSGGTLEFHATLNRMNGNVGNWSGGTVKLMTDFALEASNKTCRQPSEASTGNANYKDADLRAWVNPHGSAVLDLCGHDQSVDTVALHGGGGTITSATAAVMHVIRTSGYWWSHNYSQGFSVPSGSAEQYGFECADRGFWKGGVSLKYACTNPAQRFMMRTSSSTGCLEVVSGKLWFMRRAKTSGETFDLKLGSANPFPRLENEDGAWPNVTKVTVKGGLLGLEHGKAFGRQADVHIEGTAGKIRLEEGVTLSVHALYLDGVAQRFSTYGSSSSSARHKDDTRFEGAGMLRVVGDGMGSVLMFR